MLMFSSYSMHEWNHKNYNIAFCQVDHRSHLHGTLSELGITMFVYRQFSPASSHFLCVELVTYSVTQVNLTQFFVQMVSNLPSFCESTWLEFRPRQPSNLNITSSNVSTVLQGRWGYNFQRGHNRLFAKSFPIAVGIQHVVESFQHMQLDFYRSVTWESPLPDGCDNKYYRFFSMFFSDCAFQLNLSG